MKDPNFCVTVQLTYKNENICGKSFAVSVDFRTKTYPTRYVRIWSCGCDHQTEAEIVFRKVQSLIETLQYTTGVDYNPPEKEV